MGCVRICDRGRALAACSNVRTSRRRAAPAKYLFYVKKRGSLAGGAIVAGCAGLILGALVGGALGVGAGLLWTHVFETSCFDGYCGMLAFFSFMPIGAVLGAPAGAVGLARLAAGSANLSARRPAPP